MTTTETEPLTWMKDTDPDVLKRMFPQKLRKDYVRPSHLDIIAEKVVVMSQRPTCLWYGVAAIIFDGKTFKTLSDSYNGPAAGDVDPRYAGCARIVDGKLKEGAGLCRGSHAELNAIGNLTTNTLGLDDLQMMVTLHPCNGCAKQIVNKHIKKVWYLWEYGREPEVGKYLQRLGVEVERYTSPVLTDFVEKLGFHPIGEKVARD